MTTKDIDRSEAKKHFQEYFSQIRERYQTKDFTELSLRTPLENLITSLNKEYNVIQEPKRTAGVGAPDFKAFRRNIKIGFIETKELTRNLDDELKSQQIEKYSSSIDNLILTNYIRFILIRAHSLPLDLNLFTMHDLDNSKFSVEPLRIAEALDLIETFFDYNLPTISSASELSFELAKKTRLLKVLAKNQLEEDIARIKSNEMPSTVHDFLDGARELIKDISVDDCSDAYAQTITYGLFLAKMNCPGDLGILKVIVCSEEPPDLFGLNR